MKRGTLSYLAGVLTVVILVSFVIPTAASLIGKSIEVYPGPEIVINGTKLVPKDEQNNVLETFIYNGSTYVPLRAVSQGLGNAVSWDAESQSVYIGAKPDTSAKNTISIGLTSDLKYVDPHFYESTENGKRIIMAQMYEGLTEVSSENEVIPLLCDHWRVSEDGLTYTFYLKDNVVFHNGEILTPADVVFSISRAKRNIPLFSNTIRISSIGEENSVRIDLYMPSATFTRDLAGLYIISQKAGIDLLSTWNEDIYGTGPYRYLDRQNEDMVNLSLFERYHGKATQIETIQFSHVTDMSAMALAMENAEIDFACFTGANAIGRQIVKSGEFEVSESPFGDLTFVLMNHQKPLLDDKRVRQAINFAVDRDSILDLALDGYGVITSSVIPPNTFGYSAQADYYTYDPDKARSLLLEVGTHGLDVGSIIIYENQISKICAEMLQGNLKDVGMKASVEVLDDANYFERLVSGNYTLAIMGVKLGFDGTAWHALFDDQLNFSGYTNPALDELFLLTAVELELSKRLEYFTEVQTIVAEDAVYAPLFTRSAMYIHKNGLDPGKLSGSTPLIRNMSFTD